MTIVLVCPRHCLTVSQPSAFLLSRATARKTFLPNPFWVVCGYGHDVLSVEPGGVGTRWRGAAPRRHGGAHGLPPPTGGLYGDADAPAEPSRPQLHDFLDSWRRRDSDPIPFTCRIVGDGLVRVGEHCHRLNGKSA